MTGLYILACVILALIVLIVAVVVGEIIYWQFVDGWINKSDN